MQKRLGGMILLGLGGASWFLFKTRSQVLPEPQPVKAATSSTWIIPHWPAERGHQLAYKVRYDGTWQAGGGAHFGVAGKLLLTVLEKEATDFAGWLSLQPDLQTTQLAGLPEELRQSLLAGITLGVPVHFENRGWDLQLDQDGTLAPLMRDFWSHFLERSRVALPKTWQTGGFSHKEIFGNTSQPVHYQAMAQATLGLPDSLHKSWSGTLEGGGHVKGEADIILRRQSSLPEQMKVRLGENWQHQQLKLGSESLLQLDWDGESRLTDDQLIAYGKRNAQQNAEQAKLSLQSERAIQTAALGGKTLDEIWHQLQAESSEGRAPSQDLYLQLKAWIALHPDGLQSLLDHLSGTAAEDPQLRLAIKALMAVGHDVAQRALCQLLDHYSHDAKALERIVTSLGFVVRPSVESQRTLVEFLHKAQEPQIVQATRLALGIMGRRLTAEGGDEARKRAEQIEDLAWKELALAKNSAREREALAMFGNLGPQRWQELRPYWESHEPSVRAQAFMALRAAPGSEVSAVLLEGFKHEEALGIRQDILQSLMMRPADGSWFEAIHKLWSQRLDVADILQVARALSKQGGHYPGEVERLLDEGLAKAPDAKTRAQVEQLRALARSRQQNI